MKQDLIWEYYQNEAPGIFTGTRARLTFLAEKLKKDSKVLNIGVGAGVFEQAAIRLGLDPYSLDPDRRCIEALRHSLGMGEKAQVGYSSKLPFPEAFFDAVVTSELLEHLAESDMMATLGEIHRVLLVGGRYLGTVPAREDLSAQIVICPDCGKRFHRWGHVQSFNVKHLREILSQKFEVEELCERPYVNYPSLNWKGKIGGFIKLALWWAGIHGSGECIYFCARKP